MKSKNDILEFFSNPVPPTGTPEWAEWKNLARALGKDASTVALQVLAVGSEGEQYAALLALREVGFEAWGEGYGSQLTYKVRKIGETEWIVIKPLQVPEDDDPTEGYATGTK